MHIPNGIRLLSLIALLLAGVIPCARAANYTWVPTTSGTWDATNWGGVLPTGSDILVLKNGGTALVPVGVTGTYLRLSIAQTSGHGGVEISGGLLGGGVTYIGYNGVLGAALMTSGTWSTQSLEIAVQGSGSLGISGGLLSTLSTTIGDSLSGIAASVNVSGGTFTTRGDFSLGHNGNPATLNISGGLVNAQSFDIGGGAAGSSYPSIFVTGGTLSSPGIMHFISGNLRIFGGLVDLGSVILTGPAQITLSGSAENRGILETRTIAMNLNSQLSFNGGVLRANASQPKNFLGSKPVSINAGGAFFDSNGTSLYVDSPMSGSGVVTKQGLGTVFLSGANTYTGGTIVRSGTLQIDPDGSITHTSTNTIVGDASGDNAALLIAGGNVTDRFGDIAAQAGSRGSATVTSGTWINSSDLRVGMLGSGSLTIDGGTVSGSNGRIGTYDSGQGTATVKSGTWKNSGVLSVGYFGSGTLQIDGGSVSNQSAYIGHNAGSSGSVFVNGGTWNTGQVIYVGQEGSGSLAITTGLVSTQATFLGNSAPGTATISGGTWNNAQFLGVGVYFHAATLNINGGYTFSATSTVGNVSGGVANVTSGTWFNDTMYLGVSNSGTLAISGGLVTVTKTLYTGSSATGRGTIVISGSSGRRGVLETSQVMELAGSGTVRFNGGVLRARADQSDFVSGFEANDVVFEDRGGFIDSNGYSIGITRVLSGTGALNKLGEGVLRLSGSNMYSGGTVVQSGTLTAAHNAAAGTAAITVKSGAVFLVEQGFNVPNDVVLQGGSYQHQLGAGQNLAGALDATSAGGRATALALLAGTTSGAATLSATFSLSDAVAYGDVLHLSGIPIVSGQRTDLFVLELSVSDLGPDSYLAWLNGSGQWVNAVEGNFGNNASGDQLGFAGSFDLFQNGNGLGFAGYGTDLSNYIGAWGFMDNRVWAVLNHNSDFGVVPEPSAYALLVFGSLAALCRRRR